MKKLTDAQVSALRSAYVAHFYGKEWKPKADNVRQQTFDKLVADGYLKGKIYSWQPENTPRLNATPEIVKECEERFGLVWFADLMSAAIQYQRDIQADVENEALKKQFNIPTEYDVKIHKGSYRGMDAYDFRFASGVKVWQANASFYKDYDIEVRMRVEARPNTIEKALTLARDVRMAAQLMDTLEHMKPEEISK